MTDLLRLAPPHAVPTRQAACSAAGRTLAIGLMTALLAARSAPLKAQTVDAAVAVDVTITQTLVSPGGEPLPPVGTPTRFRLQRLHGASGWRTVLTYHATPARDATPVTANPLDGARIEYVDGASGLQVFDRDGRLNQRLSSDGESATALPVFDGATRWLEAFVFDPADGEERRREIERRYGPPTGEAGGLERYHSEGADTDEEILVDPRTGLITESRHSRNGRIQRRTRFDYARLPDGRLARRTMRTEESIGADEMRSIVTVTWSNLTVGGGR